MRFRPWVLVFFAGCATSAGDVEPATPPREPPPVIAADDDDEAAAPPAAAPKPPAKPAAAPAPEAEASPAPDGGVMAQPARQIPRTRTAADPFGDVGFSEVNTKEWLAGLREKLAQQEKVPPGELQVSPGMLRVAYVRSPAVVTPTKPRRRPTPRRHEIVVVDNQGQRVASFRAVAARVGDEPPKDLRFLSEEKLVYEVVAPPPGETSGVLTPNRTTNPKLKRAVPARRPKRARALKATLHAAPTATPALPTTPPPPTRLFVIQPLAPRAKPIRCEGVRFTFSRDRDRLAFVAGPPEAAFVAVDGAQLYPRHGRTAIASAPVWSKDGHSLAFLEVPAGTPARLVLVAELDNATGDTTWDLPPAAPLEGAGVFWAGSGKLVVGKTPTRPIFSSSFTKESPARGAPP
jgi:hypothetical protein